MKTRQMFAAIPAVVALLAGCTWNDPLTPTLSSVEYPIPQNNGEIVQNLMTINQNEIDSAKLAVRKADCPKVKHFAEFLIDQHKRDLRQVKRFSDRTGIKPTASVTAANLAIRNTGEMAHLELLSGKDFNKAYIADTIRDHKATLQIIDRSIKQSSNAKLTSLLKKTRRHVEHHLHRAEELKKN